MLDAAFRDPHPPVYVTNFRNNTVIKVMYAHNVNQHFDWENDIFEAWPVNSPVEPQVSQLMASINAALPAVFELPAPAAARMAATQQDYPYPTSAYEAIANPAKDLQVHNFLMNHPVQLQQTIVSNLNAFNPIAGFNPGAVVVTAVVKFIDGSTANYVFNNTSKVWTRVANSARDSHNNSIPETPADVAGGGVREYDFGGGGTDLDNFLERVNQFGIEIAMGPATGTRVGAACTTVSGTTVCRLVFY